MKAVGYVRCLTCGALYRGYKPRGWKPGDELHAWRHRREAGWSAPCDGSYKAGHQSKLAADIKAREVPA